MRLNTSVTCRPLLLMCYACLDGGAPPPARGPQKGVLHE